MSSLSDEILSYYGIVDTLTDEELMHYGMPRRSGRYPYGSGDQPFQHSKDFLGRIEELKNSNFTYTDENGKTWTGDNAIAKSMGLTSSEYRRQVSWANYEKRCVQVATAKSLQDDGLGPTAIGKKMGLPESTVRSLLNPKSEDRMNQAMETVNYLRDQLEKKGMIDVGSDVARELNISKERLDMALDYLEKAEGCPIYKGGIPQPTNPGQQTNQRVLCLPGTKHSEIYDYDRVQTINDYISPDGGDTFQKKFTYPASMDSKRSKIRYNEEGGLEKYGIIELRRGVDDLSLGESRYAQVRILVDGTHYLKGMAVYSDDMPDGVDVVFNTNKKKGAPVTDVLKKIKGDPDKPFGSLIKDADQGGQYWYTDSKTGKKKLGLINKRAEEGDWTEWADALPSQFLGKQSLNMVKKQLGLARADKEAEFEEICSLNNPTIKKHLLGKFADGCDSAAVHLKAAALPGQKYHVILPINTLKDNEVYAPGYKDGSKLALIRYPHGGTFEIPICTVNNKNPLARKLIGEQSIDAVGLNSKVAERLSGADFDGDTVMCIPTHDPKGKVKISSTPYLDGLVGFDPKTSYGADDVRIDSNGDKHYYQNGVEYRIMTKKGTQTQMGIISNLITDMTLVGASDDDLAKAVRHSMVVIDAHKHKLNYKQSEIDNNISALHKKYQGKSTGGAATILSKAKGQESVPKRKGSPYVNIKGKEGYDPNRPEGALVYKTDPDRYYPIRKKNKATGMIDLRTTDGKKISYDPNSKEDRDKYAPVKHINKETGEITYTNKAGDISYKIKESTQKSTKMAETDDAYSLISRHRNPKELAYADYANSMKALANKARLEMMATGKIEYDKNARKTYQKEYDSLMRKLNNALLNSTRERAAIRKTNAEISSKLSNKEIEKDEVKKASQRALTKYRDEVGSISRRDRDIEITDREWEAIQAGAISESKLKQILDNTNIDTLRERATPRATTTLSPAKVNQIKAMSISNYTLEQIASKLGCSKSTVSKYLKGVK